MKLAKKETRELTEKLSFVLGTVFSTIPKGSLKKGVVEKGRLAKSPRASQFCLPEAAANIRRHRVRICALY